MKIYIASSWKNEEEVLALAKELRNQGQEVDAFCDPSTGRKVFRYLFDCVKHRDNLAALKEPGIQSAFEEDKKWIDWADCVVLLLPCGKSSHLEAGYAKGKGKKLIIIGDFPKGEFDLMYGFADYLIKKEYIQKKQMDFIEYIFNVDIFRGAR